MGKNTFFSFEGMLKLLMIMCAMGALCLLVMFGVEHKKREGRNEKFFISDAIATRGSVIIKTTRGLNLKASLWGTGGARKRLFRDYFVEGIYIKALDHQTN